MVCKVVNDVFDFIPISFQEEITSHPDFRSQTLRMRVGMRTGTTCRGALAGNVAGAQGMYRPNWSGSSASVRSNAYSSAGLHKTRIVSFSDIFRVLSRMPSRCDIPPWCACIRRRPIQLWGQPRTQEITMGGPVRGIWRVPIGWRLSFRKRKNYLIFDQETQRSLTMPDNIEGRYSPNPQESR